MTFAFNMKMPNQQFQKYYFCVKKKILSLGYKDIQAGRVRLVKGVCGTVGSHHPASAAGNVLLFYLPALCTWFAWWKLPQKDIKGKYTFISTFKASTEISDKAIKYRWYCESYVAQHANVSTGWLVKKKKENVCHSLCCCFETWLSFACKFLMIPCK